MVCEKLKREPLVEAIFEIRWSQQAGNGISNYNLLLGRLYDRLSDKYPINEPLPTSHIPIEIALEQGLVQYRFRAAQNDWPVIQIGPGILTVNETGKYIWADFKERIKETIEKFYESCPKGQLFEINSLLLRYIDAVSLDNDTENIFSFLKEKMKIDIQLPLSLFDSSEIVASPKEFNWQSSFNCKNPKSIISLLFAKGKKENKNALIWETMVHSLGENVPSMPDDFAVWLDSAHSITHDWFFKLIKGDLEKEFNNE